MTGDGIPPERTEAVRIRAMRAVVEDMRGDHDRHRAALQEAWSRLRGGYSPVYDPDGDWRWVTFGKPDKTSLDVLEKAAAEHGIDLESPVMGCSGCSLQDPCDYCALREELEEVRAELDRYKREAEAPVPRTFPVMLDWHDRKKLSTVAFPTSVPWGFIEQYERAAKQIHTQTIERLAERGGLTPCEMMAVITNSRAWWSEPEETAVKALKNAVAEYKMEASGHIGAKAERTLDRLRARAEKAEAERD